MTVLLVDGANVVGSVPDGWWRDRAAAADRLHAGLVAAQLPYGAVLLVLEGRARAGVPEGVDGGVTTVHAAGEGDDEIVALAERHTAAGASVTVATADRGLIARLEPCGVEVMGPRRLHPRGLPARGLSHRNRPPGERADPSDPGAGTRGAGTGG